MSDARGLARLPLFADTSLELLDSLVAGAHERSLAPGQTLVREGDPGDEVMIVLEGEANVAVGTMTVGSTAFASAGIAIGRVETATGGAVELRSRRSTVGISTVREITFDAGTAAAGNWDDDRRAKAEGGVLARTPGAACARTNGGAVTCGRRAAGGIV